MPELIEGNWPCWLISRPTQAVSAPPPPSATPQTPAAPPDPETDAAPEHADLRAGLGKAMARIHQRGWCDGTGGNFSCVAGNDPLMLLMAPSGVDKGNVAVEALILVNGQGSVLKGNGRASAETWLHLEIVKATGAGAVLHTHSQAGTLLSSLHDPAVVAKEAADAAHEEGVAYLLHRNLEMLKGLAGITSHDCVVKVPVLSNDQDIRRLSQRASPHLKEAPMGLLIAGHGLYAWGRDLQEAMRHVEIHEFLLEQHWRRLLLEAYHPSQRIGPAARRQP